MDSREAIQGLFRMMLPQHFVTVSSFYLGKYEIMQVQWRAVAQLPKVLRNLNLNPSSAKGDKLPVDQVSWEEAVEFCARLSKYTRHKYRLPSESEWEYACRAGSTTPFHFGETITPELANCKEGARSSSPLAGSSSGAAMEVGSRGVANAFGLYDMHGNVQEWCLDFWHDNYQGAPPAGSAWESAGDKRYRVLRGGSWTTESQLCRSAERDRAVPSFKNPGVGFRIVMEYSPK
jgi:formylglycine-generating enzyme required for sulfatase activity